MSREELTRDIQYRKIPKQDINAISDLAWNTGVQAAEAMFQQHGLPNNIFQIAKKEGLIVERCAKDHVVGKVRFFSEYYSRENKIILYTTSIQKWARYNGISYPEAEELIMAHEYFHYLEMNKIGLTSKQYQVPTVKIGNWVIFKSGLLSLSEIGAHGFSRTYYERVKDRSVQNCGPEYVANLAVNINELSAYSRKKNLFG
jgi:hypothetical protein